MFEPEQNEKDKQNTQDTEKFWTFMREQAFWNTQQVQIFMSMMLGVLVMTALVYNFQRRGERYYCTAFVFIIYEVILFVIFVGNFIRGLFLNNPDYTFHRLQT